MNLGTLRLFKVLLLFLLLQNLYAKVDKIDFNLIKKGQEDNNTLLIVGGIQGDEPGGFMAASLITTHYTIKKGSVWVVPNLNFDSIIKRARGPFGDMNRKFAKLSSNDPDYDAIQRVKSYIEEDNVKMILNLHDGSGFYRKKFIDRLHSPYRWGQSSIIDQVSLDLKKYGNLEEISRRVCGHVNSNLLRDEHAYSMHNTNTRAGDKEMEKTLTYFAINQGKAAFGNEASKELPVVERAYYHILALEEYMRVMGIEFERGFELSPRGIRQALYDDIYISFYDNKIKLPLSQVRSELRYFPVKKDGILNFTPSNPLMTVIKNGDDYAIHYGNVRLANLSPDYLDMEESSDEIKFKIDDKVVNVKFGEIINANRNIFIFDQKDYRVNVIGYVNKEQRNESNIKIDKDEIPEYYSIDKQGEIYRVEFYKEDKFVGMVLVKFSGDFSVASKSDNITSDKM
ncbi:MAG: M99 family carboxypeptidase catalytic domain-containing protein [Candidatus Marinarcus sp.]|uniref:M14 family metallopeptidase n=1 Tax=Candidatus Marinarcus sp. TaxID=3100987 RepID=UPI003B00E56B